MLGYSSRKSEATEAELERIHKAYSVVFLEGYDFKVATMDDVIETQSHIIMSYPKWNEYWQWFQEIRGEMQVSASFDGQVRLFEEMQHRYGRWQDTDCLSIKQSLLQHSTPGTGRVPLKTLYKAALPGGWQARESKEYLEEI